MTAARAAVLRLLAASWGQLLAAIILLGSLRVYTETMPAERFGEAMLVLGGLGLIDGFASMAFTQTCAQYLKDHTSRDDRRGLGLGMARLAVIPFAVVVGLGVLATLPFVERTVVPELLAAAVLYLFAEPVRAVGRAMAQLDRRFSLASAWQTAEAAATLGISWLLIRQSGGTGGDLLLGAVAGRALAAALFLPLAMGPPAHWRPNAGMAGTIRREAFAFARPVAAMAPVGWLAFYLDRYLVGAMVGLEAAGLFAALSGAVSRPFSIASAGLTNLFRPDLLDEAAGRPPAHSRPLRRWIAYGLAIGTLGAGSFALLGDWISGLLIADQHGSAHLGGTLMAVLALSQCLVVVTHAVENRLLVANLMRRVLLWESMALIFGAPLIALAAGLAGSVGAAWGRVANEGLKLLAVALIFHFSITRLSRASKP